MKTQIKITGQPNGNMTLRSQIAASFSELMFNNFISEEMTKKEAKTLLKDAYKSLKNESNLSFNGELLSYDASQANIIVS